jgi:hypothetical protein
MKFLRMDFHRSFHVRDYSGTGVPEVCNDAMPSTLVLAVKLFFGAVRRESSPVP